MVSEMGTDERGAIAGRPRLRGVGLVLALALALVGCSGTDDERAGGSPAGAGASPAPASAPAPEGPFAVGRRTMRLVDESRPTQARPAAGVEGAPSRAIELHLVYPARGDAPPVDETIGSSTLDARAVGGRFPLLVWAHGLGGTADIFLPLGELWAREGYVVALPEFPLSREGIADGADLRNQPGDVSFVVDEVLGLDDGDPLAGVVDGDHIAVGGHSLGGATVLGVTYNTCCLDSRIDAAISVAGIGLPFEGGEYVEDESVPLLLVQGARDPLIRAEVGDTLFRERPGPVEYLRFSEADHGSMFWGEDKPVLDRAVLAFLAAHLRGDPSDLEALPSAVRASGRAVLRTK